MYNYCLLIPKNDDVFINACKGTKKIPKCKAEFAKYS